MRERKLLDIIQSMIKQLCMRGIALVSLMSHMIIQPKLMKLGLTHLENVLQIILYVRTSRIFECKK